jgi:bifunctional UDP-N-acetylglucosamine pyrophosphorylase / glucosamine-1-phosphate N-acetyltransferase
MNDLDIIILAGGKGTRMGGDNPKVLTEVAGRPMLSYIFDTVRTVHPHPPVVVVGYQAEKVMNTFAKDLRYALQKEQRGTGHAVQVALEHVRPDAKYIFVMYGDHPLVKPDTVRAIYEKHIEQKKLWSPTRSEASPITMATVRLQDFEDWRKQFHDFGRIIRDTLGSIVKIVEKKDASEAEKAITEVNPSYLCFDAKWLSERIKDLGCTNAQGEYYLTDLIGIAQQEGHFLNSLEIPPEEALGVNTPEQLQVVLGLL